jgi:hypothetical protein
VIDPANRKHRLAKTAKRCFKSHPPTKHFDSPLRSWERSRLLLGCPDRNGAKEKRNVPQ